MRYPCIDRSDLQRPVLAWMLTLGTALAWATPARADDAAALARHRHASVCVAVLKRDALALRDSAAAGDAGKRAEMVSLTEIGFAFVGTAYKDGLRKPLADQLLDEAEATQRHQSEQALGQLAASCRTEGAQLLDDASFLERLLVRNRAAARVDKLLAADARR
jgi:hypothetical protein